MRLDLIRSSFLMMSLGLFFVSCSSSDNEPYQYYDPAPVGDVPESGAANAPGVANEVPEAASPSRQGNATYTQRRPVTSEPKPWSTTNQSTAPQVRHPTGTPVKGKPGLVKSPYAPYAGDVDVKGIPSGTQVKCPYTGKIFIVP